MTGIIKTDKLQSSAGIEAQDILFNRALETSSSTTAIVTEKNRLRNITLQVDSMTTLDELKGAEV